MCSRDDMIRLASLDTWEMDCRHPVRGDGGLGRGGGSAGAEKCQASVLGVEFEVSLGGEGQQLGDTLQGEALGCLC